MAIVTSAENKIQYKGFSTEKWLTDRHFSMSNIETVEKDILNHIFTEKGSRVMMPEFGTRIPLMAFEPLDPKTIDIIRSDLMEVFDYDPRVKLIDLKIFPLSSNNALIAKADLLYVEFNQRLVLHIEVPTGG